MREIRSPLDGIPSPFAARADAYLVGAYRPKVVADFAGIYSANEYYRTGGSTSTFSDMFTHARASNATMVDSDGLLKWAPHNLLTYSEEFNNAAWVKSPVTTTVSANASASPDGDVTADKLIPSTSTAYQGVQQNYTFLANTAYTWTFYAKADGYNWIRARIFFNNVSCDQLFDLSTGTKGTTANNNTGLSVTSSITPVGGSWHRIIISGSAATIAGGGNVSINVHDGDNASQMTGDGASGVLIWGAHLYRSDLGGMVNNPDTASSYVPTTSSEVYLPRRNHYGWNGSSYVNKGLLLETEARTNLITSSDDMTTWTNTNTTDAKTQTGADGVSNSATLITATAGNGTILTTITAASADYVFSALVKRITGTGTVEMTIDGTNWVDVTSDINTSQYVQVGTGAGANTTNPQVGFRLVTNGDEIAVQVNQLEATSGQFSSPMPTTGTTFIRALETLTIPAAKMAWPTPNVIGPELVTNGTFDTDTTGWSVAAGNGTIQSVSGELEMTSGTTGNLTSTSISTTVGKVYKITATGRQGTFASGIQVGPATSPIATPSPELFFNSTSSADKSVSFVATATTTYINIRMTVVQSGATAYFDNISVKEIDPLSVSLQMQGEMTYADTNVASSVDGGAGEAVFHLWKSSTSSYIESVLDSDNGTGMASFIQEGGGARDVVSSTGSYFSPDVNVPFNIASRHGSTFINGATDGTALTEDTTPTALPDLSTTDFSLGYDYMGTIALFREDNNDWGDAGIAEAST